MSGFRWFRDRVGRSGDARFEAKGSGERADGRHEAKGSGSGERAGDRRGAMAAPASACRSGILARLRTRLKDPSIMQAFFGYTTAWLVVATTVAFLVIGGMDSLAAYVQRTQGTAYAEVDAGPYLYDVSTDELVPATQMYLDDFYDRVVFVGFTGQVRSSGEFSSSVEVAGGWDDGLPVVYATMDMLRSDDALALSDWGGNYTEEDYAATDGDPYDGGGAISAEELAAYDASERENRVRTDLLLADGELGEGVLVSNVGYYVSQDERAYMAPLALGLRVSAALAPFVSYGGLAILFFRRFYRIHIDEPLRDLNAAAERIAGQDLDFQIGRVRGRELGRLGQTLEDMRASLLSAQRELWRMADDRRRLNAAFAHDLRTPLTVLKGTLEMARMRLARTEGEAEADPILTTLTDQVHRLETYTQLMSRVTKLEDREVVREQLAAPTLADMLERQVMGYVATCGAGREARVVLGDGMRAAIARPDADRGAVAGAVPSVAADVQLVEEALGNVLGNACGHARRQVSVEIDLLDAAAAPEVLAADAQADAMQNAAVGASSSIVTGVSDVRPDAPVPKAMLRLVVTDDGSGFTAEALHRGCDPFYSEAKSAEHFGLGLSIARTLARLHGGNVVLGNLDGGGARVTLLFDVTPCADLPAGTCAGREAAKPGED